MKNLPQGGTSMEDFDLSLEQGVNELAARFDKQELDNVRQQNRITFNTV